MDIINILEKESLELRDLYLDCQGNCDVCFYQGDCELETKLNSIKKDK